MREMEGGPPPPGGPPVSGDKSTRSVFVGNIPYEATEEKLKDIFSEVIKNLYKLSMGNKL